MSLFLPPNCLFHSSTSRTPFKCLKSTAWWWPTRPSAPCQCCLCRCSSAPSFRPFRPASFPIDTAAGLAGLFLFFPFLFLLNFSTCPLRRSRYTLTFTPFMQNTPSTHRAKPALAVAQRCLYFWQAQIFGLHFRRTDVGDLPVLCVHALLHAGRDFGVCFWSRLRLLLGHRLGHGQEGSFFCWSFNSLLGIGGCGMRPDEPLTTTTFMLD